MLFDFTRVCGCTEICEVVSNDAGAHNVFRIEASLELKRVRNTCCKTESKETLDSKTQGSGFAIICQAMQLWPI